MLLPGVLVVKAADVAWATDFGSDVEVELFGWSVGDRVNSEE